MNSLQKESQKCSVLILIKRTTHYTLLYLLRNDDKQQITKVKMNITTKTKTTKLDYRDFVRDENNKLVHKSKIKNNTSISRSNNNKKVSVK